MVGSGARGMCSACCSSTVGARAHMACAALAGQLSSARLQHWPCPAGGAALLTARTRLCSCSPAKDPRSRAPCPAAAEGLPRAQQGWRYSPCPGAAFQSWHRLCENAMCCMSDQGWQTGSLTWPRCVFHTAGASLEPLRQDRGCTATLAEARGNRAHSRLHRLIVSGRLTLHIPPHLWLPRDVQAFHGWQLQYSPPEARLTAAWPLAAAPACPMQLGLHSGLACQGILPWHCPGTMSLQQRCSHTSMAAQTSCRCLRRLGCLPAQASSRLRGPGASPSPGTWASTRASWGA